ncbi:hypothetical protein L202_05792 [Cryptococcus amylolentus CBS 6039]|uniref:Thioredoxin domain-containing protein n=1 Tax=Cryptococcus amylolentus CBS 6039 TaxID=1295533 RepID=A0A1E3HI29_9TREE|nr:hypothetical protein L202_05792 [Cryptococcus amylolentus CBS 6039]ODN75785.1 hypothetical protein L202_05792 [Cryptococcus amylolentus CBS 6039]
MSATQQVRRKPVPTPLAQPVNASGFVIPDSDFGSGNPQLGLGLPSNHPFANPSPIMSRSVSYNPSEGSGNEVESLSNHNPSLKSGSHGRFAPVPPHRVSSRSSVPAPSVTPKLDATSSATSPVEFPSTPESFTYADSDSYGPSAPPSLPSSTAQSPGLEHQPSVKSFWGVDKAGLEGLDERLNELRINNAPYPVDHAAMIRAVKPERPLPAVPHLASDGHRRSVSSTSASGAPSEHIVTPVTTLSHASYGSSEYARRAMYQAAKSSSDSSLAKKEKKERKEKERLAKKYNKDKRRNPLLMEGETEADITFSVDRLVTRARVEEAAKCFVRDEEGNAVPVSSLLPSAPGQKTVIFFIRSFWCGQCQDYTLASISILSKEALEKAGVRVVIVGHGNWKVLKAYRNLFNCPFDIYVDGPRRLYRLMGLTKGINYLNPWGHFWKNRAEYNQRPVPTQVLHGLSNVATKMPKEAVLQPGSLAQLGGEFIFSYGNTNDMAHRMTNASNHMEAPEVLRIAGVAHPTVKELADIELGESQRDELERLRMEMERWKEERALELERINMRKIARRQKRSSSPSSATSPTSPDSANTLRATDFDESDSEDDSDYDNAEEGSSFSLSLNDVLNAEPQDISGPQPKSNPSHYVATPEPEQGRPHTSRFGSASTQGTKAAVGLDQEQGEGDWNKEVMRMEVQRAKERSAVGKLVGQKFAPKK